MDKGRIIRFVDSGREFFFWRIVTKRVEMRTRGSFSSADEALRDGIEVADSFGLTVLWQDIPTDSLD